MGRPTRAGLSKIQKTIIFRTQFPPVEHVPASHDTVLGDSLASSLVWEKSARQNVQCCEASLWAFAFGVYCVWLVEAWELTGRHRYLRLLSSLVDQSMLVSGQSMHTAMDSFSIIGKTMALRVQRWKIIERISQAHQPTWRNTGSRNYIGKFNIYAYFVRRFELRAYKQHGVETVDIVDQAILRTFHVGKLFGKARIHL